MIVPREASKTRSRELLLGRHNHPQCEMSSAGTNWSRTAPETRSSGTRPRGKRGGNGIPPGSRRSMNLERSTGSLRVRRGGLPGEGGVGSGRKKARRRAGRRRSTSSCGPTSWLVDNYCGVCLVRWVASVAYLHAIAATRACFELTRYSPPPSGCAAASGSTAAGSAASPTGFAGECTPISAPECAAMLP